MPRRTSLFVLLALVTLACRRDGALQRFGSESIEAERVRIGGSAREVPLYALPAPATFWLHKEFVLPAGRFDDASAGVYVSMLAPFEVWWDGARLGASGVIGPDGRPLAPGPIDNVFVLDARQRAPGRHHLAIRVAAGADAARVTSYCYGVAVGPASQLLRAPLLTSVAATAGLGLFVVAGIYFLSLYLVAGRGGATLTLALLCFATAALVVAESWRWLIGYTYDWHIVRLQVVAALTFAVAFLLAFFFILDLRVPRPRVAAAVLFAALLVAATMPRGYDDRALAMFWCAFAASALAVVAARRQQRRARHAAALATLAMMSILLLTGYRFGDGMFSIAFAALLLVLFGSMALQLRDERREHAEARLRAARMEIEVLKKSLQPHFLMNTLTAVMEWIEANPSEGVQFLSALADELRILTDIAGERSIPLARELELCRSHLAIMRCRKGTEFELAVRDCDLRRDVPPAIFHTLVENAITHNDYGDERVTFTLRAQRNGSSERYVFDAPLGRRARRERDGTGLRYVQARLEESYPGRWQLESAAVEGSWRTTIVLPA